MPARALQRFSRADSASRPSAARLRCTHRVPRRAHHQKPRAAPRPNDGIAFYEMEPEIPVGSVLLEREALLEEELWREEGGGDHAGWFCVRTDAFPCPAPGCDFVAEYMTAAHLILVWEERDDPNLLRHAQRAKEVGRNPSVVEYQPPFGPSASYYAWEAAGRPVHGIRR